MKPRIYFNTHQDWLWYLYNNRGYRDLRICLNIHRKGETYFSKWFLFDDLMHVDPDERMYVGFSNREHMYMTRNELIENATHRTVMDTEIVYDIDDVKWEQGMELSSIRYKAKCIQKKVNGSVWFTGSKSYHIHTYIPKMKDWSKKKRRDYKASMLELMHSDMNKASEKCMIAMEMARHYKSGKRKVKVIL